ncbi:MAG: hypothetical protein WKF91_06935 [Segetibacter sp.]
MRKLFLIYYLSLLGISHAHSQSSIGWTESQIIKEYSENPNASISNKFIDGKKNIIVVDPYVTASFEISSSTGYCDKSLLQFEI